MKRSKNKNNNNALINSLNKGDAERVAVSLVNAGLLGTLSLLMIKKMPFSILKKLIKRSY